MKELLLQYAEYNVWANKRVVDALLKLEEADISREIVSSFTSVSATVIHVMGAESIWLQRLQLVEQPVWLPATFKDSFSSACDAWQRSSADLVQFVAGQQDGDLSKVCTYNDLKGNSWRTPVNEILHHVFNHATYHRGQLVTIMRQLGVKDIPGTDFIGFVRL